VGEVLVAVAPHSDANLAHLDPGEGLGGPKVYDLFNAPSQLNGLSCQPDNTRKLPRGSSSTKPPPLLLRRAIVRRSVSEALDADYRTPLKNAWLGQPAACSDREALGRQETSPTGVSMSTPRPVGHRSNTSKPAGSSAKQSRSAVRVGPEGEHGGCVRRRLPGQLMELALQLAGLDGQGGGALGDRAKGGRGGLSGVIEAGCVGAKPNASVDERGAQGHLTAPAPSDILRLIPTYSPTRSAKRTDRRSSAAAAVLTELRSS
jgi:hypothetical protein